jgi:hypothetical protein
VVPFQFSNCVVVNTISTDNVMIQRANGFQLSFKFYKNDSASFNYIKEKSKIDYIDILIAAESVRVASYKKEYSFIAENLINELQYGN